MKRLRQQLKVVHDELTTLMAEAKLDSLTRKKLAEAAIKLMKISHELDAETSKPAQSQDPKKTRSVIHKAMSFLAAWGKTLKDIITMMQDDDGS